MLKRLVLVALLVLSVRAQAAEYTDVYYDAAESGWGVFLVQSDTTQFLAFFIYGPDGKPTWYVAILASDGAGGYTGSLYATTGTYFASPWQGNNATAAGTVKFAPTDRYHATLTYTVNGVATVTKTLVRQTLTAYQMGGTYSGSMAGSVAACSDPTQDDPSFRGNYKLTVTQDGDTDAALVFTFVDPTHSGTVCTVSGPLTHFGRLYQLAGQIACTGGNPHPATLDALHPTGQGIEGYMTGTTGGGCQMSLHFAAVLDVNN
ncbi:MAG TPA: hypothetical protein VL742_11710 [Casimicrobiaceae bacterium]|nr:hypothetical protein [Casimicrobiaceae bacterium]